MIDLHTHILPGLDDGPRDLAAALTMAEVAAAAGIETMVATPHVREDYPKVDPFAIAQQASELTTTFAEYGVPVRVLSGGELAVTRAVDLDDAALRAITLGGNGRDLLVETPHSTLPSIFEVVLADLQARGFRVTLAHPELNPDLRADLGRLARIVEDGVLVQITAESLGARWAARGRWTRRALKAGLVHVISSDCHSATWRAPDLGPAVALGALGRWLTCDVPAAILTGDELPPRPA